jgi:hypothetical protein
VLAWDLVEHPLVAVAERQLEHFAYLEVALVPVDPEGVVHIFEVVA